MAYNFVDFLPLHQRKAGNVLDMGGNRVFTWAISPYRDRADTSLLVFKNTRVAQEGHPDDWNGVTFQFRNDPWVYMYAWNQHRDRFGDARIAFPIIQRESIYFRFENGQWTRSDITQPDTQGKPYALARWRLGEDEQLLYALLTRFSVMSNGEEARRAFHYQQIRHRPWRKKAGVSWHHRTEERHFIDLQEAYWDSVRGWVLGSGEIGGDGEPSGENIEFGNLRIHGYGGVPYWIKHRNTWVGTRNTWFWP